MRGLFTAFLGALAVGMSFSANAAVRYDFATLAPYDVSAYSPQGSVSASFSYTSANFINLGLPNYLFIPPSGLGSCTASNSSGPAACDYTIFQRSYVTSPYLVFNQIQFTVAGSGNIVGANAYFADGSFTKAGTYFTLPATTIDGPSARLIVTDLNASAVPEPTSWAMMIIGFGVIGSAMRRKKVIASFA